MKQLGPRARSVSYRHQAVFHVKQRGRCGGVGRTSHLDFSCCWVWLHWVSLGAGRILGRGPVAATHAGGGMGLAAPATWVFSCSWVWLYWVPLGCREDSAAWASGCHPCGWGDGVGCTSHLGFSCCWVWLYWVSLGAGRILGRVPVAGTHAGGGMGSAAPATWVSLAVGLGCIGCP